MIFAFMYSFSRLQSFRLSRIFVHHNVCIVILYIITSIFIICNYYFYHQYYHYNWKYYLSLLINWILYEYFLFLLYIPYIRLDFVQYTIFISSSFFIKGDSVFYIFLFIFRLFLLQSLFKLFLCSLRKVLHYCNLCCWPILSLPLN